MVYCIRTVRSILLVFDFFPIVFIAQQHICRALYMLSRVRLSASLSHGWISQQDATLSQGPPRNAPNI